MATEKGNTLSSSNKTLVKMQGEGVTFLEKERGIEKLLSDEDDHYGV